MSKLDGCNRAKGIIVGDFNATLNDQDKTGGIQRPNIFQRDFEKFIDHNQLMDTVPKKVFFPGQIGGQVCLIL